MFCTCSYNNKEKRMKKRQVIISYFEGRNLNPNTIRNFLIKNPEIKELCTKIVQRFPEYENELRLIKCIVLGIKLRKCIICGKTLTYKSSINGALYCSYKCSSQANSEKWKRLSDEEKANIFKKRENTYLERFGTTHPMKNENVKQKTKDTCLKKYGVESPLSAQEVMEKRKQTCLDKYGCEFSVQSESVKEKIKQTCLDKYGVESPAQAESVKKKIKDTLFQKYGCTCLSQIESVKEKRAQKQKTINKSEQHKLDTYGVLNPTSEDILNARRKHCIEKYGCEHPMKNMDVQERSKQTMMEHYGTESFFCSDTFKTRNFNTRNEKWKEYVIPLFEPIEFEGNASKKVYKWKCVKCGNIFEQRIYNTNFCSIDQRMPRCLHCYPLNSNGKSNEEKEVYDYICSIINEECISTHHIDENGKYIFELDIYIPKYSIAIEFDGLFWHNEKSGKNSNYHLWKTNECKKRGIRLIHIFEDEWVFHKNAVKDYLARILHCNHKKISSHNCLIKNISTEECLCFLNENSFHKHITFTEQYGLFWKGNMIAVMALNKENGNRFEISSIVSKANFKIYGLIEKFLNHFDKIHPLSSLIYYMDIRYEEKSEQLIKYKFEFVKFEKPEMFYVIGLNRYTIAEYENLDKKDNKINKIYDCGKKMFIRNNH